MAGRVIVAQLGQPPADGAAIETAMVQVEGFPGAGPFPQRNGSYYPYTLPEEDFLRQRLAASEGDIRAFKEEAEFVAQLS